MIGHLIYLVVVILGRGSYGCRGWPEVRQYINTDNAQSKADAMDLIGSQTQR